MPIVAVALLMIGLIVIGLVAVLARLLGLITYRDDEAPITKRRVYENAAPLTRQSWPETAAGT